MELLIQILYLFLILIYQIEGSRIPRVYEKLIDEQRIIQRLLQTGDGENMYDWRVRPRGSLNPDQDDQPVHVAVNIYLRSIAKVDDVNMDYLLHFTFRQEWTDERLLFFSENLKHLVFSVDEKHAVKIWSPDTFFQNEKSGKKHDIGRVPENEHNQFCELMQIFLIGKKLAKFSVCELFSGTLDIDSPNVMIRIYNGTAKVLYSCRLTLTLSCPMQLSAYPLDIQTCYLDYASYAYTSADIIYNWAIDDPIQIKAGLHRSLPSFMLSEVSTGNCTSVTNTGTYSCLRTVLKLKREFSYYLLQLYIPSFMLVSVSTVSFWLDEDSVPARVCLGVTVLLTVTTMASGINANLPPVSYTKSVDIWIGVCTGFIFGALLEFALVNWASRRDAFIYRLNRIRRQTLRSVLSIEEFNKELNRIHCVEGLITSADAPLMSPKKGKGPIQWWLYLWRVRYKQHGQRIDLLARVTFPLCFIIFNIIYWSIYLTPYLAVRTVISD